MDWDATGVETGGPQPAARYWNMVEGIRSISGHAVSDRIGETTGEPARLIEVRASGGHYVFRDLWPDIFERTLNIAPNSAQRLRFPSNYTQSNGAGRRSMWASGRKASAMRSTSLRTPATRSHRNRSPSWVRDRLQNPVGRELRINQRTFTSLAQFLAFAHYVHRLKRG
ncbi:hypothetical protein [Streptomyces sp. KS 21]|uniref:hypothetical protein n=1 Tax=Streptomyces sp. KS 21 TaxID=2485150 RepID=UPI0010641E0A|nr:hypothetical protein [Streptomyces sp. KS 21]